MKSAPGDGDEEELLPLSPSNRVSAATSHRAERTLLDDNDDGDERDVEADSLRGPPIEEHRRSLQIGAAQPTQRAAPVGTQRFVRRQALDDSSVVAGYARKQAEDSKRLLTDGIARNLEVAMIVGSAEDRPASALPMAASASGPASSTPVMCPWPKLSLAPRRLSSWGLPLPLELAYMACGVVSLYDWQRACMFEYFKSVQDRTLTPPGPRGRLAINLLYTAPTSGGKSLVAELVMLRKVLDTNRKAFYIVPFVALAEERAAHLTSICSSVQKTVRCHAGQKGQRSLAEDVLVCTTEKANVLLNTMIDKMRVDEICCVVVDEVHLIAENGRGYVLEMLLTKLIRLSLTQDLSLVGMSATLANAHHVAKWMADATLFMTDFRPVPLKEHFVVGGDVFTSTAVVNGEPGRQKLRSLTFPKDLLAQCGNDASSGDAAVLQLALEGLVGGFQVLVFAPSRKKCEVLAGMLQQTIALDEAAAVTRSKLGMAANLYPPHEKFKQLSTSRAALTRSLRACGALDPVMERTIPFGIAYHHAALLGDEKVLVEGAFRTGTVWVICCTTTLATGVNLPARRVIFASPRIATAYLDPARYKQASGRAGRSGLDPYGDSYLVGKANERSLMASLVGAALPPIKSNFALERRGMMRVLLEGIVSGEVQTVEQIEACVKGTLLAAVDDYSVVFESTKEALEFLETNQFITWDLKENVFSATLLGQATVASSLAPDEAMLLYLDLEKAKHAFAIAEDLHLVFYCTPPFHGIEPNWHLFYHDVFMKLSPSMCHVVAALGADEGFVGRAALAPPSRTAVDAASVLHRRLYAAFILLDVVSEVPLSAVAARFMIAKGEIQRLMEGASTFSSMLSTFCDKLNWWFFPPLIDKMSARLQRGVSPELVPLMKIQGLAPWRARELFRKGYRTVLSIATAPTKLIESALSVNSRFSLEDSAGKALQAGPEAARKLALQLQQAAREALEVDAVELHESISEISSVLKNISKPANAVGGGERAPAARDEELELPHGVDQKDPVAPVDAVPGSVDCSPTWQWISEAADEATWATVSRHVLAQSLVSVSLCELPSHKLGTSRSSFLPVANTCAVVTTPEVTYVLAPVPTTAKTPRRAALDDSAAAGESVMKKHRAEVEERGRISTFLIRELLPSGTVTKAIYDAQSFFKSLVTGMWVPHACSLPSVVNAVVDPLVAEWIIAPEDRSGGLRSSISSLSAHHLGSYNHYSTSALVASDAVAAQRLPLVAKAISDSKQCLVVSSVLLHKVQTHNVMRSLTEVEMPIALCLAQMELNGVPFRRATYDLINAKMTEKIRILIQDAYRYAGVSNWTLSSPKDCARILFDVLHFPSLERTFDSKYVPKKKSRARRAEQESRSTKATVLKSLQTMFPDNPMPSIIREFRTLQGWQEKFIYPLVNLSERSSDRAIRGQFLQTATATGRLAMNDPNLQTIPHPIEFKLGEEVVAVRLRRAFVASSPDHLLLSADYAQIEARLLAHFSQDENLLSAFRDASMDIFIQLAMRIFHVPDALGVSVEQRRYAKALCYGMIYGKGKGSIAEELEITEQQAEEVLASFRASFPTAMSYIASVGRKSGADGYVDTILGRRRYLAYAASNVPRFKAASDRMAVNTICQGSAADIVKTAMIRIAHHPLFSSVTDDGGGPAARLLLQVHDELLFDVRKEAVAAVAKVLASIMDVSKELKLTVELPVKIRAGPSWDELVPVDSLQGS